jgi:hypothetical protein
MTTDDELTGKDINEIHSALSYWGDKQLHDLFDNKFIHKVRVREAIEKNRTMFCNSKECTKRMILKGGGVCEYCLISKKLIQDLGIAEK